jgi:mono/diheme cytochrome c family protein
MHDLGIFLGRFHPVWVHMPIGIFLLLGLLEIAGLLSRLPGLSWLPALGERQRTLILWIGAAAAIVTASLGWLLAHGGDYELASVHRHQSLGIAAAAAAVILLVVHRIRWAYGACFAASLGLLALAADAGGRITHGGDYLTAHMPHAVSRLLGISVSHPSQARVATLDNAAAYADVIQPILQDRCVSCHGPAKSNGGLRLDTWDMLTKGGKHGALFKAGDLAASLIVQRTELPIDLKEHMPPRGKPQLADDDLTLIEWWVGAGAPREARVATLDLPPAVEVVLEGRLAGAAEPPARAATFAAAARLAWKLGIVIRPLSPDGPWLDVSARVAGRKFGDHELDQLGEIAPAVQWLDIGNTAVTDAGLAGVAAMPRLVRLHLDGLKVTNAGLARLSHLHQLQYLNLRGTLVTDKGLPALQSLPRLRALYVWQTAVTPAAVQALGDSLVDKRRLARWKAGEAELEREIKAEHFEGNTGEELNLKTKPVTSFDPKAIPQPAVQTP